MSLSDVIWPLIIFVVLMLIGAKVLSWGLEHWSWKFLAIWMVVFGIIGFAIELHDRKRRRFNELRRSIHPERDLPDL